MLTSPKVSTADATGNINNDSGNIANYDGGADWNGQDGNVTTVGSGGAGSRSFYGAADMGGNVWEWNESEGASAGTRVLRGGSYSTSSGTLKSASRLDATAASGDNVGVGFRVAGH